MSPNEEKLMELQSNILHRKKQITTLYNLFNLKDSLAHPSIFIFGHAATGKNFVLETMFSKLRVNNIFVSCVECFTAKLIFENIIRSIPTLQMGSCKDIPRCDNTSDFVRLLKKVLTVEMFGNETLFIVIDKCERLRSMDGNLLPAFMRLNELTQCNISVIFISEIIFDKFRQGTGVREPFQLHFPDYTKMELIDIMYLDAPDNHPKDFYRGFCKLLLSVFYNVCRDLRELRHLAQLNFPKYCEPIRKGEATYVDVRKLWRNIEPCFKKALNTVFLHEVSSSQWEQIQEGAQGIKGLSSYSTLELPYYSKYLLIAAYLASYNPAKSDRQFFCKTGRKMTKRAKVAAKKGATISCHAKGPHPFVLDRLMAIFYSIVDENVPASAVLLNQLSSLVTLHFLAKISPNDQLDTPKYKCMVSFEFIKSIARQLEFDLGHYLYDFINQ